MIGYIYLQIIPYIVVLCLLTSLLFFLKKPKISLYILVFTFLLKNIYIFIGTRFDIWFLISLSFAIIYSFHFLNKYGKEDKNRYETLFIFFNVYVFVTALIGYVLLYYFEVHQVNPMLGGWFKNEGRIIPQLVFFFITTNLIFVFANIINSSSDIKTIISLLIKCCCLLSVVGLFQYVYVVILGASNPFPIQSKDVLGHSGYIGGTVFRINSIAGEPKHLGVAMALGMSLILLGFFNNIKFVKHSIFWFSSFALALFLTFSTTGYVLALIGIFIALLLNNVFDFKKIIALSVCTMFVAYSILSASDTVQDVALAQSSKAGFEVQDQAVMSSLLDEPLNLFIGPGIGNIHHYAVQYFPPEFPLFRNTPFKGNTGLAYLLGDFGVVGFLFFYASLILLMLRNLSFKNRKSEENVAIQFTIILSVIFIFRYTELLFVFIGISIAINKNYSSSV